MGFLRLFDRPWKIFIIYFFAHGILNRTARGGFGDYPLPLFLEIFPKAVFCVDLWFRFG